MLLKATEAQETTKKFTEYKEVLGSYDKAYLFATILYEMSLHINDTAMKGENKVEFDLPIGDRKEMEYLCVQLIENKYTVNLTDFEDEDGIEYHKLEISW